MSSKVGNLIPSSESDTLRKLKYRREGENVIFLWQNDFLSVFVLYSRAVRCGYNKEGPRQDQQKTNIFLPYSLLSSFLIMRAQFFFFFFVNFENPRVSLSQVESSLLREVCCFYFLRLMEPEDCRQFVPGYERDRGNKDPLIIKTTTNQQDFNQHNLQ